MKSIAIIPGKRESRRCPNKNTRNFLGRPIVEWTIEAARESRCFDSIILVSDIVDWASYVDGVVGWWSNFDMANDGFTVVQVCEEIMKKYCSADFFTCLLPTAPMRTGGDIHDAFRLLDEMKADGVMGVTKYVQPWWQALDIDNRKLTPMFPNIVDLRENESTAIIGEKYVDNGSMYVMRTRVFLKEKTFYVKRLHGHLMPYERSIDINTETDFEVTEFLAKKIYKFSEK